MKKAGFVGAIVTALVIFVAVFVVTGSIVRIPTGYEGVVYSMKDGVTDETLGEGWHIISPTKNVRKFTISNEQLILSEDDGESFKISTSDDAMLAVSFQMSYQFKADKLTDTYKRFRGMDGEDIVNNLSLIHISWIPL